jgi:hypothetical protein
MKQSILIQLAILCLFACTKSTPNASKPNLEAPKTNIASLSGYWVKVNYLKEVTQKGPNKSQENAGLVALDIKKVDSLWVADANLNFHEGQRYLVREGTNGFNLHVEGAENIMNDENLTLINEQGIEVSGEKYIKLNGSKDGLKNLQGYIMGGTYLKTGKGNEKISFARDGTVTGWGEYHFYETLLDYTGPGIDFDMVMLRKTDNQATSDCYAFKRNGGKLLIYKADCVDKKAKSASECIEYKVGKLIFDLGHQKD